MPKWLLFVGGFFALLGVLACVLLISGHFVGAETSCNGYPVMVVNSKAGGYRAEVQNDTCGADGSLSTVVMLSKVGPGAGTAPEKWSAFIASSTVLAGPGVYAPLQLQVRWLSDSEIEIAYPIGTQLHSRAEAAHGVSVIYRERSVP
jgi:hypothetical protein